MHEVVRLRRRRPRAVSAVMAAALAAVLAGCSSSAPNEGPDTATASPSVSSSPAPEPSGVWDDSPDSLAALGDSITRGFDTCELLADCPGASWATGSRDEVDSLADRVLPAGGKGGRRVWNMAETGARMVDLPEQARKAVAKRPRMVTILMGANDACRATVAQMTPVEEYRADFAEALGVLDRELPHTQVFVASVPDLRRLWEIGREDPLSLRAWRLGICPSMLRDPAALTADAEDRREAVRHRVAAYNEALRDECERHERCRHDGGAVFEHRFSLTELSSWDRFHPGVEGQRQLARIAYRAAFGP